MKVLFCATLFSCCALFLFGGNPSQSAEVWGGACGTYATTTRTCISGAWAGDCTGTSNCSSKIAAGTCPTQSVQYTAISAGTIQLKADPTYPCGSFTPPKCFYDTAIQACNTHATQTVTAYCNSNGAYNITTGGCGGST